MVVLGPVEERKVATGYFNKRWTWFRGWVEQGSTSCRDYDDIGRVHVIGIREQCPVLWLWCGCRRFDMAVSQVHPREETPCLPSDAKRYSRGINAGG